MSEKEQGTTTIEDEPTVEQHNRTADETFAAMAFIVMFNENHPDKAVRRLRMLSNHALDWFIHIINMLKVMAERERLERQARKAEQDEKAT